MLDHAVYLYGFNLMRAEALVKDLSPEQMVAQPAGLINHPSWSLGHLVVTADRLGQLLGLESSLPESWSETFKTGGEPSGVDLNELTQALAGGPGENEPSAAVGTPVEAPPDLPAKN